MPGRIDTQQVCSRRTRIEPLRRPRPSSALRVIIESLESRTLLSADVVTYRYDTSHTGADTTEVTLTPANVNSSDFGRRFSLPVDGLVYAQPLYVSDLAIPGKGTHNVIFVATEGDSVYAFDADSNTGADSAPLWKTTFVNGTTVTTTPNDLIGGITASPVIDLSTDTMYVVARTYEKVNGVFTNVQRLHALNITTGAEKYGQPVVISATIKGNGAGSAPIIFNPTAELNRSALVLDNGVVYMGFSIGGGWLMGYNATTLAQVAVFKSTPDDTTGGGIWMSGAGVAVDSSGDLFLATGNGLFDTTLDPTTGMPIDGDYGDSFLKLAPDPTATSPNGFGLRVADYFTPSDQAKLDASDLDLGSGGVLLLPKQPGAHPDELIGAGKDGTIYVIDRDDMGHYNAQKDAAVQEIPGGTIPDPLPNPPPLMYGTFDTPAYFNNTVYYRGSADTLKAYTLSDGMLITPPVQSIADHPYLGANAVVSANGTSDGIVWEEEYNQTTKPGVLVANEANDVSDELYRSPLSEPGISFVVPVVANGMVYVGTASSIDVYGLLPTSGSISGQVSATTSPVNLTAVGTQDWAHWGLGGSANAFEHKATGGSQISNVARVGTGQFGGYTNPSRSFSWTDGTPVAASTADHGYVWARDGIGAGYSFTVPASTTVRTLYVYLGGYSSGSTLTAHLSDGSALDYVVHLSSSTTYSDVIAITYHAASAGQTLTLTYVKSQNINGSSGTADLSAAWLGAPVTGSAAAETKSRQA